MIAESKLRSWCTVALLLILVVSAVNVAQVARHVPPPPRKVEGLPADRVLLHEQRLDGVRAALAKRGVSGTVGYVGDLSPETMAASPTAMENYFLSQFALVPWVLETRYDDCDWAVANFRIPERTPPLPAGFRVVEDFGAGVLLLRKATP